MSRISRVVSTAALLILAATTRASINGFGNFSNFTINQTDSSAAPTVSPGTIQLTNQANGEARSIFYDTPQSISQFTVSFTYQATSLNSFFGDGGCLVLQNASSAANAIGSDANGLGYFGIANSAAVSLEIDNGTTASALYTGGSISGGATSTSPINFFTGDSINVTLTYNGSLLSESLVDETTSATFNTTYVANLPSIVGGSTAYIGITASTNGDATQTFSNFQFTTAIPEPASLSVLSLIVACGTIRPRARHIRR